ncbi:hypothetical protein C8F01DRAFT_1372584 [Mycena amicta]|nr:hypothetical protein C8F01DRAFT_1372584 [Mycena amicta]
MPSTIVDAKGETPSTALGAHNNAMSFTLRSILTSSATNFLLVLVPISYLLSLSQYPPIILWTTSFLSSVPLLKLLDLSLTNLVKVPKNSRLFLSQGNIFELLIALHALYQCQTSMVQLLVIGSLLCDLLLIHGGYMLVRGSRMTRSVYLGGHPVFNCAAFVTGASSLVSIFTYGPVPEQVASLFVDNFQVISVFFAVLALFFVIPEYIATSSAPPKIAELDPIQPKNVDLESFTPDAEALDASALASFEPAEDQRRLDYWSAWILLAVTLSGLLPIVGWLTNSSFRLRPSDVYEEAVGAIFLPLIARIAVVLANPYEIETTLVAGINSSPSTLLLNFPILVLVGSSIGSPLSIVLGYQTSISLVFTMMLFGFAETLGKPDRVAAWGSFVFYFILAGGLGVPGSSLRFDS